MQIQSKDEPNRLTTIRHPFQAKDHEPMAHLREASAPAKGHLDPEIREVFDQMMEMTPDAPGIIYEETSVGISPLYGDLADLPPIRLHVGADEVLLDDSRRYAQRVVAAGGIAELHIWEGMTHVFPSSVGTFAASEMAIENLGAFLYQSLR